jgi:hypothetical protein
MGQPARTHASATDARHGLDGSMHKTQQGLVVSHTAFILVSSSPRPGARSPNASEKPLNRRELCSALAPGGANGRSHHPFCYPAKPNQRGTSKPNRSWRSRCTSGVVVLADPQEKWCGVDRGDADPMTYPTNTKPRILRRLRTGQTAAAATRPHMHHYGWIVEE